MNQLVILSGKGGTGKTSVAAAFAHLAHDGPSPMQAVLADADVDAANLELVLQPQRLETHDFTGGSVAVIDAKKCERCGACLLACRFDAIAETEAGCRVDRVACDGCAACAYRCPVDAIRMEPQIAGQWFYSESRYGPLFHAALRPAQENSGKLVTLVKQQARLRALDEGYPLLIVDGPPGIGCPVISAVSGADLVLVVAEPTVAGIHDMKRALRMAAHFRIPAVVCINKADLYLPGAGQIEAHCCESGVSLIGRIPFDMTVTEAMVRAAPVTAYRPDAPASQTLADIWRKVAARLDAGERMP
jgi:MinD superfamily P-loop ATPase